MTEAEWDDVIAMHLKGHFAPTRWAATYWREQHKAGHVRPRNLVHTSSARRASSPTPDRPTTAPPSRASRRSARSPRRSSPGTTWSPTASRRGHGPGSRWRRPDSTRSWSHGPRAFDEWDPANVVAARRVPQHRGLPVHRRDVLRAGRVGAACRTVVDRGNVRVEDEVDRRRTRRRTVPARSTRGDRTGP